MNLISQITNLRGEYNSKRMKSMVIDKFNKGKKYRIRTNNMRDSLQILENYKENNQILSYRHEEVDHNSFNRFN